MAASTMDLELIEEKANSVYEAVLIVAKRARAITAERKAREVLDENFTLAEFDYENPENNVDDRPDDEKAVVVAMQEFFDDKLEVNYRSEDEA